MWVMSKEEQNNAVASLPDLANIPSIDGMLALYEKVLAELDSAISAQKDFAGDAKQSNTRNGTEAVS